MHAFITGATGFLGKHLVEQLLQQGWQITALCRDLEKIETYPFTNIQWKLGSLTDIHSLQAAVPNKVDAVFHLAGDTSTWSLNNRRQYHCNVTGSRNLAQVALEKQCSRFIHTSSISVYGFHDTEIDENSEKRSIDSSIPYFRTKYLGEEAIREFIDKGLDIVFLNPVSIIGPYDQKNWIQLFTLIAHDRLPGIPCGSASFCFAPEVAKAHIQAFIHGRTNENYILSGPTGHFVDIAHWVGQRMNKKVPSKPLPSWLLKTMGTISTTFSYILRKEPDLTLDKARIVCADVIAKSNKAQRELHYQPDMSMEDMLEETYQWWLTENQVPTMA